MYLKFLSDGSKKIEKHFTYYWPVSSNLKKALKEEDIKNFALIDVLEKVVAVKNQGEYTNKQIARIIKIISDGNVKFMKKINGAKHIDTEICFDKERFTEAPGNYLVVSSGLNTKDRLTFSNLTKKQKADRAFVVIYNTDENQVRTILFLSEIILKDHLIEEDEEFMYDELMNSRKDYDEEAGLAYQDFYDAYDTYDLF